MTIYQAILKSSSPYGQSQAIRSEKNNGELDRAFEERTWRERMHVKNGYVDIPAMSFKNCLSAAAKYRSEKIPGKRNATYTKKFESGIFIAESLVTDTKADSVPGLWLFVPSDGVRGGGKRVWKCFPVIDSWDGRIQVHVLDDVITKDVLRNHLEDAGSFIGIGFFRPERNGYYGRFKVESLEAI